MRPCAMSFSTRLRLDSDQLLYTELALRAKGVLMMRENGLDTPVGQRTREKFDEMAFLENSIGKTGLLAMKPFLHMTRKDLWQLYVLEK